ncbi:MAG: integration host factor subunit beta [Rickettsiaceae bacterium]|nr:integration host factor subunit beta [Rickettsiaceae bacterium]MDP4832119.1 integration host factor subunit beta [Rickettsiaceae bacterium]MDP5020315.1 integration host factor subunit beta [Rickettsiaceae bacterium]MDP5082635.1 integration host factor subunit beta [Rickettsiaceae bacterium]
MATKRDLVESLSKKLGYLNLEDAKCAVDCVLNYIKDELAKGNRVEIRGFGSMSVRKRKYASRDEHYNTVYYRMSKNVQNILNK